jgi:hypothetical protein
MRFFARVFPEGPGWRVLLCSFVLLHIVFNLRNTAFVGVVVEVYNIGVVYLLEDLRS